MPFAFSDGTCVFCHDGFKRRASWRIFGTTEVAGHRPRPWIPLADGTLFPLGAHADDALMPSLLTLSDVMGTGHAAIIARVTPGKSVAVVGDGAVGLCGVIAAKRLGAGRLLYLAGMPTALHSPRISARQTS
jgi:threonine dehydrogenase-like Zn-dependent dehydrogenase